MPDLIIVGAGPAGLSAAQYGARANLNVLVIEQTAFGGQVLLIDKPENYPGNIEQLDEAGNVIAPQRNGYELSMDFHRQAESFGAAFCSDSVTSIKKENNFFTVSLSSGETQVATAVILATGSKPRLLGIPGEKEFSGKGVSYCAVCDGHFFKGKKIIVVGGGDAACDEGAFLSRLSDQITIVHRSAGFRAQKAIAERTLNNPNIKVCFNTKVKEIKGEKKVKAVLLEDVITGNVYEEETDAVFVFIGMIPQTSLAGGDDFKAELDKDGYIITDRYMATCIPGLFAAGDVRAGVFRQIVTAAADGATAAKSASEYIDKKGH